MNKEIRDSKPVVALFVTCLVDLFRPSVAFATIKLLELYGYRVVIPKAQTCCGQPAYNSGDYDGAKKIALKVINALSKYDAVVIPSASCAGMMSKHFVELFKDDLELSEKLIEFSKKTHELISFLSTIPNRKKLCSKFKGSVTYHDSCSSLREAGIKNQTRDLLREIDGLELKELKNPEVCCGFGGTFSVKYPDISEAMIGKKLDTIQASGADIVVANDSGCLMQLKGAMGRRKLRTRAVHLAELLDNKVTING